MRFPLALLMAALLGELSVKAEIKMPAIFGDHMVLEQQAATALVDEGPRYAGMTIEGNVARISYRDTRSPLTIAVTPYVMPDNPALPTDKLTGFAIAGDDRKWVFARAEIDGATVKVWSEAAPKPVAVRYGWSANPAVNLYNQDGFPALPFRTDDWPYVPPPPFPYPPNVGPFH